MSFFKTVMWTGIDDKFSDAWTAASATPKPACTGRSCSETLACTDCTANLLAILLKTYQTAIGRMPPFFLRRAVNEDANSASRDQYERFSFKIWYMRRDIELRTQFLSLYAPIHTRSRIRPRQIPSTPMQLLPA